MSTEAMIEAARTWRGLAKLTVVVESAAGAETLAVKLGEARRRWKRIALQLANLEVLGARGYDEAGELVGSWDAPDDDDEGDGVETSAESLEQAQHRQHTQWVMREMTKVFEVQQRLVMELGTALIETFKRAAPQAAAAQPTDDEASRTLGMLLQTVMSNQNNNRSDDADEEKRDSGSPRSDATVPGPSGESGQAGS